MKSTPLPRIIARRNRFGRSGTGHYAAGTARLQPRSPAGTRWQLAVAVAIALAFCPVTRAGETPATQPAGPRFELRFKENVQSEPFSGRVYLAITHRQHMRPIDTVEWFDADRLCAQDVYNWQPSEPLVLTAGNTLGFPDSLADLPAGTYRVQAVIDTNKWHQHPLSGPGNGFSSVAVFAYAPPRQPTVRLIIDRVMPAEANAETPRRKRVRLRSRRLSDFHGRDVFLEALVNLPAEYGEAAPQRFPAVYIIPGFGGSAAKETGALYEMMLSGSDTPMVIVFLYAGCPTGHHVFADSANNGPWGTALVTELIPHLETKFRLRADADGRFLTGHSSGGWSSLWLQVRHPQFFGGVWSTSPDPVDFRDFMSLNIYEDGANAYVRMDGAPRPISRTGIFGRLYFRELSQFEQVLGRGGQLGSFEAVFSPRRPTGEPAPLWNRGTGAVHQHVGAAWRAYDIRRYIERNWPDLEPHLRGKLHLYCGAEDDFYLERAFVRLRDTLTELGSDAHVVLIENATHVLPLPTFMKIGREMADAIHQRQED